MIAAFKGEHRFLSNFFPAPVVWLGHTYPTVEHAFQAAKFAAHPEIIKQIQEAETPGDPKRIANKNKMLIEPSWCLYVRELVMWHLLNQKFAPGSHFATLLRLTGTQELVEGNTWGDVFWGVCEGKGQNNLGRQLMAIRDALAD